MIAVGEKSRRPPQSNVRRKYSEQKKKGILRGENEQKPGKGRGKKNEADHV